MLGTGSIDISSIEHNSTTDYSIHLDTIKEPEAPPKRKFLTSSQQLPPPSTPTATSSPTPTSNTPAVVNPVEEKKKDVQIAPVNTPVLEEKKKKAVFEEETETPPKRTHKAKQPSRSVNEILTAGEITNKTSSTDDKSQDILGKNNYLNIY